MLAGDVKFYLMGGKVEGIYRTEGRLSNHEDCHLDRNWIPSNTKSPSWAAIKPFGHERMVEMAEMIGEHFDFIRVDFLSTESRFVLNELTLYTKAGYIDFSKYSEHPFQLDLELGKKWDLKILESDRQ